MQQQHDMRLKTFFRMVCAAPAGAGKTTFCHELLKNKDDMFDRPPVHVVYYYRIWHPIFDEMSRMGLVNSFVEGVPSMGSLEALSVHKEDGGSLIIIDDQIQNVSGDLAEAFQVGSRHNGVSLIFLTQNLFPKNRHFRDISLNATYVVIFKNPRDGTVITNFAKQFRPGKAKYISQLCHHVTREPYSYLLIDLHQTTPEAMRLRSDIFPHQLPMKAWNSE